MGRASNRGTCGRFVKHSLFFTNFITLVAGIVIVTLGIWAVTEKGFAKEILGNNLFNSGVTMFVIAGCVLAVVCFFGCYGIIKEKRFLLLLYSFIIFLTFATLLTATVFCFLYNTHATESIINGMNSSIKLYDTSSVATQAWDRVQEGLHCCGIESHQDWDKIPQSCCSRDFSGQECSPNNTRFQRNGCFNITAWYATQHVVIIGATGILTVVLTFFATAFSCILACF